MSRNVHDVLFGVGIAIPLLFFFHVFFVSINEAYELFMADFVQVIYDVIVFVFNIEFLWKSLIAVILGYFVFSLFQAAMQVQYVQKPYPDKSPTARAPLAMITILTLIVILFGIFSFFQTQTVFSDLSSLPFKDLSLYAQQGFWELIIIFAMGYMISLLVVSHLHQKMSPHRTLFFLILIFLAQLVLIKLFNLHKLFVLQSVFGLKDQRLVADGALLLMLITPILLILHVYGKIRREVILQVQFWGLLAVMVFFHLMPVDWLTTTVYPTQYYENDTAYKDYSYLLINAYDNVSYWPELMAEFQEVRPPRPQDYHWGPYKFICVPGIRTESEFTSHTGYLEQKYSNFSEKISLRYVGRFHLGEYRAYRFLKEHETEVQTFEAFLQDYCEKYSTK